MNQGCPHCGRGTEANPHPSGWRNFFWHEIRCWGFRAALYNAAWLWTHPNDEDERIGDGQESYA